MPYTIDDIKKMDEEQLKAAQKELGRIILKRIAVRTAVWVTIIVALKLIVRRLDENENKEQDEN